MTMPPEGPDVDGETARPDAESTGVAATPPPPTLPPPPPPGYLAPGAPGTTSGPGFCHAGHPMAPEQQFCAACGAPRATGVVYVTTAPATRTNGFAIASLVLGIVWIYGLGSILALVFGLVARSQINQSEGSQKGTGLAVAGIVLGIVGIVGLIALIVGIVLLAHNANHLRPYNIHTNGFTGLSGG